MKTSIHFNISSERGSLLIVAMLMSAIIALSLTSYLQLTRSSLTISNRALYNNAAMNLAENGLEESMYSINKKVLDDTYDWTGWTNNGVDTWRKWTGYTFDQNSTGIMRVYVYHYLGGGGTPRAVARATVTLGGGPSRTIEKWVEVRLRKTSKFSSGLVAKNSVLFNGNNVTVDSWDSVPNNATPTVIVPYSSLVRNDNGSVGSISVSNGAVSANNGDVWGWVSTAGDDPTNDVGPSGSILGETSPVGSTVDPARVATDFSASFDAVTAPAKTYYGVPGGTINGTISLPLAGATRDADGNFYYTADKIAFNNETVTITDKVVLQLTDTTNAIRMQGNDSIISITAGSLDIYAAGDISLSGKGVSNGIDANADGSISDAEAGQPANFQFWGTNTNTTRTQDIAIHGNGVFSGTIYAPQGSVTITGNGSVSGSVVANDITLTGNAQFHYDESLADDGTGNPYRVSVWREITDATERATLSSILSF